MPFGCNSSLTTCEDTGKNKKGSNFAKHPYHNTNLSDTGKVTTNHEFRSDMHNYYEQLNTAEKTDILPGVRTPTPNPKNLPGVPNPNSNSEKPKEYFDGGCYSLPEGGETGPNCSNYPGIDHAQNHRYACPQGCDYVFKGVQVGGLATGQYAKARIKPSIKNVAL